jgi:hypothetical protein
MFTKGQRVRVNANLPEIKRYGVLVDGDAGTVMYIAGQIAVVRWDNHPHLFTTNVNWGDVDILN